MTRPRLAQTVSSSLAIGTASLFVAVAACVGLLVDKPVPFGSTWTLRGTMAPGDTSLSPHAPGAALPDRRVRSGDPLDYA